MAWRRRRGFRWVPLVWNWFVGGIGGDVVKAKGMRWEECERRGTDEL